MPLVKRYTFTTGARLSSSQLNTNFDDMYNTYNVHQHTGQGNDAPQISSSGIAPGGSLVTTTFTNPYKFSVYKSSAQNSVSGGSIIINYDVEDFDTSNNIDIITNKGRFTAPVSGFYQFNAAVAFTAQQSTRTITSLLKNSSIEIKRGLDTNWTPGYSGGNVNSLIQLNAGDYVEVQFYSGSVAAAINNNNTWFNGFLVSLG